MMQTFLGCGSTTAGCELALSESSSANQEITVDEYSRPARCECRVGLTIRKVFDICRTLCVLKAPALILKPRKSGDQ